MNSLLEALAKIEELERQAELKGDDEKVTYCIFCRAPLSKSEIALIFQGEIWDSVLSEETYTAFQICAECRERVKKNIEELGALCGVVD